MRPGSPWIWVSIKPGETKHPFASINKAPLIFRVPMKYILEPRIVTELSGRTESGVIILPLPISMACTSLLYHINTESGSRGLGPTTQYLAKYQVVKEGDVLTHYHSKSIKCLSIKCERLRGNIYKITP